MTKQKEYLDNISDIKQLMEKSSKFISLSGLSGVFAGIWALIAGAIAYIFFNSQWNYNNIHSQIYNIDGGINKSTILFLLGLAFCTFSLALLTGIFFTNRKAKTDSVLLWNKTSQNLLLNLSIPMIIGSIFCLALIANNNIELLAPSCLIFYGLALINASKYSVKDLFNLGISETILGLLGCIFIGYGFILWLIGFGVLHIIYGSLMYYKYESKNK